METSQEIAGFYTMRKLICIWLTADLFAMALSINVALIKMLQPFVA